MISLETGCGRAEGAGPGAKGMPAPSTEVCWWCLRCRGLSCSDQLEKVAQYALHTQPPAAPLKPLAVNFHCGKVTMNKTQGPDVAPRSIPKRICPNNHWPTLLPKQAKENKSAKQPGDLHGEMGTCSNKLYHVLPLTSPIHFERPVMRYNALRVNRPPGGIGGPPSPQQLVSLSL